MADTIASAPSDPQTPGEVLDEVARLVRATWAFTTRRVPREAVCRILPEAGEPQAGDLVLARVDVLGHHRGLQQPSGRRKNLFAGDEIVLAYGDRYAPSQFEAVVPKTLGPCQLVAGGGIAAKALSWHRRIARGATQITPLGLLADAAGERVNLRAFALDAVDRLSSPGPTTIAVVGTSMDSGKTTAAAFLVKGLTRAGLRVGFAKVTGTGAGGDTWLLKDAGAEPVLDFTDAGLASTYLVPPPELERVLATLATHLGRSGVDAVVLEVADGVLQTESAALLMSATFRTLVGGIIFAASDSMGAAAGVSWLQSRDLPVVALGGLLTTSPLLRQEASIATGLPTFSRDKLAQVGTATKILSWSKGPSADDGGVDADAEHFPDESERGVADAAGAAPGPSYGSEPGVLRLHSQDRRS